MLDERDDDDEEDDDDRLRLRRDFVGGLRLRVRSSVNVRDSPLLVGIVMFHTSLAAVWRWVSAARR